jgi:Ran GTPase-activating protein (RanGAP) involved in mRNA processing and transport
VDGALAISSALKKNSTLRTLSLNSNNIQYRGSIAISSALKVNSSLYQLFLDMNHIGLEGGVAMASALEENSTLQVLHLSSNEIGHKGAVAFVRAFRSSHPIAILNVDFISVWEEKLISKCRELNREEVVKKLICNEIPDVLFPQVVARLSIKQQHVNKLFTALRERPDLFN